jgi:hypothetical protein
MHHAHMAGVDARGYYANNLPMTSSTNTPSSALMSLQSNPFSASGHHGGSSFIFPSVHQTPPPHIMQQQAPVHHHHLSPQLQHQQHHAIPPLYHQMSSGEMSPSSKSYYDFNQTPPPQTQVHHMPTNDPSSFCFNSSIISSATASLLDMNGSMASVWEEILSIKQKKKPRRLKSNHIHSLTFEKLFFCSKLSKKQRHYVSWSVVFVSIYFLVNLIKQKMPLFYFLSNKLFVKKFSKWWKLCQV